MAKVITTELQHSGASGANITLDSSKNVTCENNLTVDGTTTLTGAVELPDDTVDIADLSATGTASSSTFLRGDNSWAAAGGGKVVKHAFQSYDTQGNTTSSSFQDTGLSISYTPVAANNLIYCIAMQQCYIWNNGGGDGRAQYNLLQGSTQIALSQFECSGTNSLESVGNEILMGRFTAANTNAVTVNITAEDTTISVNNFAIPINFMDAYRYVDN